MVKINTRAKVKPIDSVRNEIMTYFENSEELVLAKKYGTQRQFNYYFKFENEEPFLIYLNVGEEGIRFTIKCLQFPDFITLDELIDKYPDSGSSSFNLGHPIKVISFLFVNSTQLKVSEVKGDVPQEKKHTIISPTELMQFVAPH